MHGGDGIGPSDHDLGVTILRRRVDAFGIEAPRPVLTEQTRRVEAEPVGRALVHRRAEEDEVRVGEPPHQRVVAGDLEEALLHRREVADHRLHVVDRRANVGLELLASTGRASVEFDQRPRLDPTVGVIDIDEFVAIVAAHGEHRVDEQVDTELVAIEHHSHAVDQKRHVVGDEHQDRAFGLPAVSFEIGRQHLDQRLADAANPAELQVDNGGGIGRIQSSTVGVIARDVPVVDPEKRLQQRVGRSTCTGDLTQTLDDGCHVIVSAHGVLAEVERQHST